MKFLEYKRAERFLLVPPCLLKLHLPPLLLALPHRSTSVEVVHGNTFKTTPLTRREFSVLLVLRPAKVIALELVQRICYRRFFNYRLALEKLKFDDGTSFQNAKNVRFQSADARLPIFSAILRQNQAKSL